MSKIVYFSVAAHGHVNPVQPILQELVQRGEQVIFYNTEEFRSAIEPTGATFRAYPATELTSARISQILHHGNLAGITVLLLRVTETLLPFALEELTREQPALVMFDALALWGKMASMLTNRRAAATIPHFILEGTPAARLSPYLLKHLFGALPVLPGLIAARLRLTRRFGAAAFPTKSSLLPVRGGLNLIFTSRELHPPSPLIDHTFRFVGPSLNPQTRAEAFPFDALPPGPVIYISMGTVHTTHSDFYRQCFQTFADYPAQFILSVGKHIDLNTLSAIPSNFIVRPSVPQLEVLQRASAFITHGGMNSIHEALYYGVPLILIPHQLEQLFGSQIVAERGAGLLIEDQVARGRVPPAKLRPAIEAILSEPRYRAAAREIQKSLQATGGFRQAADEIQRYLTEG
jgi:MGT family glycosyltransferase